MALAAPSSPWVPDLGDGTYRNPVLFADYSDPDVVRVGDDYFLTSSSFHNAPGLPILKSGDLVNWTIVGHALPRLLPEDHFSQPRHGAGVWAPSIRHHAGKFFIYYPDPDFGIYVTSAVDPAGPWSPPALVKAGKGLIDPCPFWDDDGTAYLVHAWAKSRSGISNILTLHRLSDDGTKVVDAGKMIVDGADYGWRTLEGPKVYKRDGWYYIFAPAGGVAEGFQAVLRSKSMLGPYEGRVVLAQGPTSVNGPHQGAWVDTPSRKQDWFLHFQDVGAYGRIVHLEPMTWKDGWPVIGEDPDGDGTGQPVATHKKPDVPAAPREVQTPQTTDDFDSERLGLAWQWQANPRTEWSSLAERRGCLRMHCVQTPDNLRDAPNLLTQKLAAPEFSAIAKLEFHPAQPGDETGLFVLGDNYAWIGLRQGEKGEPHLVFVTCEDASRGKKEKVVAGPELHGKAAYLRMALRKSGSEAQPTCEFAYSEDGKNFTRLGESFAPLPGRWVGAKFGIFAVNRSTDARSDGYSDFDWLRIGGVSVD